LSVEDAAHVRRAFERYEQALREHDVETLNDFFLDSPDTVRYGIAEQNYGFKAIGDWRRTAPPVHVERQLRHTVISCFGRDVACVSSEFTDPATPGIGRQTQTWVRTPEGWKIIAAHVSVSKASR
jgi:hypothetical protein